MPALTKEALIVLLKELAQWLEFYEVEAVEWVVCGGVAMALRDLSPRTTQDVDVLGAWNQDLLEVRCVDDFSPSVKSCIRRVAADNPELVGLGENWVNLGPVVWRHLACPRDTRSD